MRNLLATETEMDEIAAQAHKAFEDTMNLSMNIEAKYSARMMEVAGQFLGHKLNAKSAKIDKKLKMIELQLKKAKLDQDATNGDPSGGAVTAKGIVMDRNQLLAALAESNNKD